MTDIAEIVARLRSQHIEVAHLAANAIESLIQSEAEARTALAETQRKYQRLLAQVGGEDADAAQDDLIQA